jgi:hypothetical protein
VILKRWLYLRGKISTKNKALFIGSWGRRINGNDVYDTVVKHASRAGLHNPDSLKEEDHFPPHCFRHWKQHSPYLKGMLALTLQRMGRPKDAQLVFESVMDSSRTTQDEGTFWAPEERSWLRPSDRWTRG